LSLSLPSLHHSNKEALDLMLISPELGSIQLHSDLVPNVSKVWSGFTVAKESAPVSECVELHKECDE